MNVRLLERLIAAAVFVYALIIYLLTVAPTASFWDSGEFIAIANRLQVSHPPGAPFYMLVGRLFSMFVPTEYVALSVNLVSVVSSALTVLLAHLIIVRLVRIWQTDEERETFVGRFVALGGGVIGALTFAVTDSFWFNAVESEVYALSILFTAVVIWLILRWRDQALAEEAVLAGGQHPFGLSANRILVLIAYLFGLAIGVHLLNLLAVFFIALIVFFEEFEREEWTQARRWTGIVIAGAVSALIFLIVYPGIVQVLPDLAGKSGAPVLFVLALIGAVVFALYYTQKNAMAGANLFLLCLTVVLIGYSSYALIFIRSAADPPIDENDPETTEAIVSYLKREQYGQTPLFRGLTYNNRTGTVDRETLFPRRHSMQPQHMRVYSQYDSETEFFWKYQVGHMYVRYFLWNFVGKASDIQDAPAITGLLPNEADHYLYLTPSERESRNAYFALPLILGLLGAVFHFQRDWRRAFSVLILFLVTGIGIIVYLNQTPLQPRERDYSYVASFLAFSFWVGIGASGVLQLAADALRRRRDAITGGARGVMFGIAGLLFVAVPLWMLIENYFDHDRSGRYVAPDYAHNMLLSVAPNGIIFTNGDNDTFPLWYLQEVERFRTDVRVANLSLLNTPWYILQLKNQWSRESAPLPISIPDSEIGRMTVAPWQPQRIALPVGRTAERNLGFTDVAGDSISPVTDAEGQATQSLADSMAWVLNGRPYSDRLNMLFVADQVALNILDTNAHTGWERPVYFAITVSRDGQLDLQNYFQLEGKAFRVVPIEHNEPLGRVVPEITGENLLNFRFRNIDDPSVYFDENIRRMVDNYRNVFSNAAEQFARQGRPDLAEQVLDKIMNEVPFETISGDERSFFWMARAYEAAGRNDRAVEVWKKGEPVILHRLQHAVGERAIDIALQYVQTVRYTYLVNQDFEAAADFSRRLADALNDDSFAITPEQAQQEYEAIIQSDTLEP